MLDCAETITIVSKKVDDNTRDDALTYKTIHGCSWFHTEQIIKDNKGVKSADIIKVRIPLSDDVSINKGDVLVLGAIVDDKKSIGAIRKCYPESFEAQSITYNIKSSPYSRHIRVSGS